MAGFDVVSFPSEEGIKENLVQSGRIDLFFNKLNLEEEAVTAAEGGDGLSAKEGVITILFQNLSQIMSMQGPYRGECEATLKSHIYEICKSGISPDTITRLVNQPKYRCNSQLSDVIARVCYLLKNRFVSNKKEWFVCGTKFSHHLGKTMGTLAVMSKAAAYMTAGAAFFVAGLNKFYLVTPKNTALQGRDERCVSV